MSLHKTELFVPAITPFAADLSLDTARLVRHGRWLLENGADGLAPFGTTSEANSLGLAERQAALDALLEGGIVPDLLMPGTGCCAIPDTVSLTAQAVAAGCRGVLMLPPFFYKGISDDGLFAAYSEVIERVGDGALRVYLYHIPQMSGVGIPLPVIERLLAAYPRTIAGLKDSSGKWDYSRSVIEAFPTIAVYSASESLIPVNVATGGAGCISASSNVNPAGIRALIGALGTAAQDACAEHVASIRTIFEGVPLIPAIKAAVASLHGDPGYARTRPPFAPLDPAHDAAIKKAVALAGEAAIS